MKLARVIFCGLALGLALVLPLRSQVPDKSAVGQLKAIKEQNAKLLQQQAATLEKLDEMAKTAQQVKIFSNRG